MDHFGPGFVPEMNASVATGFAEILLVLLATLFALFVVDLAVNLVKHVVRKIKGKK